MNLQHKVKLITPTIKRKLSFYKRAIYSYRRMRTIFVLNYYRKILVKKKLAKERINNDGSLKQAFGLQKQIELIDFLLGDINVLP